MRFMLIMFPGDYGNAKPGMLWELKDIETMNKYNEQLQEAGVLLALDGLTPPATMSARVTFKSGKSKVTDGPFPEAKEVLGGYWVLQVKSREALEWASRIPARDIDMVEVRRMFEVTDFRADVQKRIEQLEQQAARGGQQQWDSRLSFGDRSTQYWLRCCRTTTTRRTTLSDGTEAR